MESDKDKESRKVTPGAIGQSQKKGSPEWASGLRRLYDSVVDEPLPDSFKDLISKLDKRD